MYACRLRCTALMLEEDRTDRQTDTRLLLSAMAMDAASVVTRIALYTMPIQLSSN